MLEPEEPYEEIAGKEGMASKRLLDSPSTTPWPGATDQLDDTVSYTHLYRTGDGESPDDEEGGNGGE